MVQKLEYIDTDDQQHPSPKTDLNLYSLFTSLSAFRYTIKNAYAFETLEFRQGYIGVEKSRFVALLHFHRKFILSSLNYTVSFCIISNIPISNKSEVRL